MDRRCGPSPVLCDHAWPRRTCVVPPGARGYGYSTCLASHRCSTSEREHHLIQPETDVDLASSSVHLQPGSIGYMLTASTSARSSSRPCADKPPMSGTGSRHSVLRHEPPRVSPSRRSGRRSYRPGVEALLAAQHGTSYGCQKFAACCVFRPYRPTISRALDRADGRVVRGGASLLSHGCLRQSEIARQRPQAHKG